MYAVPEDAETPEGDDDPVSDFSLRLSPYLGINDPEGNLTWSLRYQPSYEAYLHESDLNGFDHSASGTLGWHFADRWQLHLQEYYSLFENTTRFNESEGTTDPLVGFESQEIRANRTLVVLTHALTPRDNLSMDLGYNFYEFPDGGGNDRTVPSAALAYEHVLSERTTIGTRLSWVQQAYDRQAGGDDKTQFYNLSATLEYRFSPTLRLEAEAGPTWIDSQPAEQFQVRQFGVQQLRFSPNGPVFPVAIDADTCAFGGVPGRASVRQFEGCGASSDRVLTDEELAVIEPILSEVPTVDEQGLDLDVTDSESNDLTYFARLGLFKTGENWNGSLVYHRSNSDSAQFGSSSVADTLEGTISWSPFRHWTFNLSAGVSLQEQTSDQLVPIAFQLVNVPAPPGVTSVAEIAQVQSLVASTRDNSEEYLTQSISLGALRQLTQHSSVFASVYWYSSRQDVEVSGFEDQRWDNLTLWVGLDWAFDTIRF